jgi:hypothetical protein
MRDDAEDRAQENAERVALLAQRFRQSLQVCSTHTAGPLAAYSDCVLAVRMGKVTYADFRTIGTNLISASRESIDKARGMSDNLAANSRIAREERIIRFVSALFCGSDEESLKWQADRLRIEGSSE